MIVLSRPFGFCYSVALQSVTRLDQMSGSELAADTLINENKSHLDYHSHLRFDRLIGSRWELINIIMFHVKQLRQEQRQERNKRYSLSNSYHLTGSILPIRCQSFILHRQYIAIKFIVYCLLSIKTYLFILSHLCFIAFQRQ